MSSPTLDRVFKRGVSDQHVQAAMDRVRAYVTDHMLDCVSDLEWWAAFGTFFDGLVDGLSESQRTALEIATDTTLVHAGVQPWSLARVSLAVARRDAAEPMQVAWDH